jgi:glycosyltransferase involved in cell wall biosynthesis
VPNFSDSPAKWLHIIAECFREVRFRSARGIRFVIDWWTIRKSGVFDSRWYLEHTPSASSFKWGLLVHYLAIGTTDGNDPNPLFDTSYYLGSNQDVAGSGINPLSHYIRRGAAEGRKSHPSYDFEWCLRNCGFDAEGKLNPLIYYLNQDQSCEINWFWASNPHTFLTRLLRLRNELALRIHAITKTVAVVIRCHNDGKLLRDTVESALKQLYSHLTVIIVDDGSTDEDTLWVLSQLQSERVCVVRQEYQGKAAARNRGAQSKESDYLVFLDPEDRMAPEAVALLVLELEEHPDVAYAYPECRGTSVQATVGTSPPYNAYDILWRDTISSCGLIRSGWFRNSPGFETHLPAGHEDWRFALGISVTGGFGQRVPVPMFYPRSHSVGGREDQDPPRDLLVSLLQTNELAYSPEAIFGRKIQWRPTISVVTVLCNRMDSFSEKLSRLWKQTVGDFEVIVMDHGSHDHAFATFLDSLCADQRVRMIYRCPAGAASPGSDVLNAVRSDYICFIDEINSFETAAFETLSLLAALHPERQVIQSNESESQSLELLLKAPHLIRRDKCIESWNQIEKLTQRPNGCEHQDKDAASTADSEPTLTSPECQLPITQEFSFLFRDHSGLHVEKKYPARMPSPFQPRYWRDNRIQILYCIPFCTVGGAEKVDLDILSALPMDRFRVTLVRMQSNEELWLPKFRGVVDEVISIPYFSASPSQVAVLVQYLCVSRCIDLIFNRNTYQGYDLAEKVHQITSTVAAADLTHTHNDGDDWIGSSAQFHERLDARFVVSSELKQHAYRAHGLPSDDFTVIHNGIDITRALSWEQLDALSLSTRTRLGIPKAAPVIGFVGRMAAEKDLARWIEVACQIAGASPAVHFVVAGDGNSRSNVEVLIKKSPYENRFHLTGYVENVDEVYAVMSVLLLTSRYEGLPIVFLEAMLQGVPVVSTRVGGVSECVTEDVGILVDSGASASSIADEVLELLNRIEEDPDIRSRCRARIQESFSLERMQSAYVRKFEALCAGRNIVRRLSDYELWAMTNPNSWQ